MGEKVRMIEDIIRNVEETELVKEIDFGEYARQMEDGFMVLQKFYNYFDRHIQEIQNNIYEKYLNIGKTMLPYIEFSIFQKVSQKPVEMKIYYNYWERKMYNAISKMIIRGLVSFKVLLQTHGEKSFPLFKIISEFQYDDVTLIPSDNEIGSTIDKLFVNIQFVAAKFPRWQNGTCSIVDLSSERGDDEKIQFTYLNDINKNPIIKILLIELGEIKKCALTRVEKFRKIWGNIKQEGSLGYQIKKFIWDQKHKIQIDKIIERNPSIQNIEFHMDRFQKLLNEF